MFHQRPMLFMRRATSPEANEFAGRLLSNFNSHPWRGHPSESVVVSIVQWSAQTGILYVRLNYGTPRLRWLERGRVQNRRTYNVADFNQWNIGEPVPGFTFSIVDDPQADELAG